VATLKVRVLTAFVVSFASAMRQLECKRGVSPLIPLLVVFSLPLALWEDRRELSL